MAINRSHLYLLLLLFAGAIYIGSMVSPPSLMDDVDAVQAQIASNMLTSHDWVTARLAGVAYMEKAPLIYWLLAICYKLFGVYDWVARIPVVLAVLLLACVTMAFGNWAFKGRAGFYAGLSVSTCVGLFLFTRIQIPDVMLTANIALTMWAFLRTIDEPTIDDADRNPRWWAFVLAASLGVGLLWKSLIGVVFPVASCLLYLAITGQLLQARVWKRIHPFSGFALVLLIAAPWHILGTLRNPPYFDFTMRSAPGEYHGFLWFYFMNEQVLRFLNRRYPRDYDTVPRLWFWLLHLVWLFPWSVYLPAIWKGPFRPVDRAGKTRLLALCWAGFILVFFTFSTTQEYYSMPCYPALALLLGSAMEEGGVWIQRGTRVLSGILALAALACFGLWFAVKDLPTPGDISVALSQHPSAYTLSLGHMGDLTIPAFAYLRAPLLLAGFACLIGALGTMRAIGHRAFLSAALMAVLFFQAARMALVVFDPYMSSRPLAEALLHAPKGRLIVDHHYYTFSSVIFYVDPVYPERDTLLLNGRIDNLVYGSYAPDAPKVFIDDAQWKERWYGADRYYLVATAEGMLRLQQLGAADHLVTVSASGGKVLLTNHPIP